MLAASTIACQQSGAHFNIQRLAGKAELIAAPDNGERIYDIFSMAVDSDSHDAGRYLHDLRCGLGPEQTLYFFVLDGDSGGQRSDELALFVQLHEHRARLAYSKRTIRSRQRGTGREDHRLSVG